jgi:hypothetical protein
MAKKKGTVSSYNNQDVSTREYYYDRYTSDENEQNEFSNMIKDLNKFNEKLMKELEKGEKAEFKLTKGQ